MSDLRLACLGPLLLADAPAKAAAALALPTDLPVDCDAVIDAPPGIPGRPARPRLVEHITLKPPSMRTPAGVAALVHSIAHIEFNAINLALDIIWRYSGMPADFYRDWALVAKEEAYHFSLLAEHLQGMGHTYGEFPAHDGLWEMAQRTSEDLLARLALVPRTLEARGLDASPAIRDKLAGAGDERGAEILDIILRDEIGHVAIGNKWYGHLCRERGLDPVAQYRELARHYRAPRQRGPFNMEARRKAGFSEAELAALLEQDTLSSD